MLLRQNRKVLKKNYSISFHFYCILLNQTPFQAKRWWFRLQFRCKGLHVCSNYLNLAKEESQQLVMSKGSRPQLVTDSERCASKYYKYIFATKLHIALFVDNHQPSYNKFDYKCTIGLCLSWKNTIQ